MVCAGVISFLGNLCVSTVALHISWNIAVAVFGQPHKPVPEILKKPENGSKQKTFGKLSSMHASTVIGQY